MRLGSKEILIAVIFSTCILGQDAPLKEQSEACATEYSWSNDTVASKVVLSGAPYNPSSTTVLNVTLGGIDVDTYQYKLASQTNLCTGSGYNSYGIPIDIRLLSLSVQMASTNSAS